MSLLYHTGIYLYTFLLTLLAAFGHRKAGLWINGPISAGTNVTITNNYALRVNSGVASFAGNVQLQAAQFVSPTTTSSSTYGVGTTEYIISSTRSATGAQTVNLPAVATSSGRVLVIKDAGGLAGTNNITLDGNASETIDGATTFVMNTNYGSTTVYCDGSAWYVI